MRTADKLTLADKSGNVERYNAAKLRKTQIENEINELYKNSDESDNISPEIRKLRTEYQEQHQIVMNHGFDNTPVQNENIPVQTDILLNPYYREWKNITPHNEIRISKTHTEIYTLILNRYRLANEQSIQNQCVVLMNWTSHLRNLTDVGLRHYREEQQKLVRTPYRRNCYVRWAAGELPTEEWNQELANYYKNIIITEERCNLIEAFTHLGYELLTTLLHSDVNHDTILTNLSNLHDYISSIDSRVSMRLKRESVFPTVLAAHLRYTRNPTQTSIEGQ
jgi:hypothetical protein